MHTAHLLTMGGVQGVCVCPGGVSRGHVHTPRPERHTPLDPEADTPQTQTPPGPRA